MKDVTNGMVLLIIGGGLIMFRKWFARYTIDAQNWTFGFHFGKKMVQATEWLSVPFGTVLLVLGALTLLNIIKW